ncbi:MAG: hypothetical protein E7431_06850 [Ruminococcaceae bacterium]|nr:hypothetical protein [Oscillospiraceae bacterium]
MEAKLIRAANLLPEPALDFDTIKQRMKVTAKPTRKTGKALRAVLVAALAAGLLCGMGWAKLQYSMWLVGGSNVYNDLENMAGRYDVVLPENLGGTPFCEYQITGLVPQGAPWAIALINPSYKPRLVTYGWVVEERLPDLNGDWNGGVSRWTHTDLRLNFGTTKNDLWRYFFEYDENGLWTGCEVPESYRVIEYRNVPLQVGDTLYYDEHLGYNRYTRWVHWVDEEKQVVFSIHEKDYADPNRVVECAKLIIDLNK